MPLQTGQLLEQRYRIEMLLGQGGMGAVYGAIDLRFNTPVAIKENLEVTADSQRQFSREAALLHQLRHPNLPRVTDYFFIPDHGQYLVMDYVEGEDLKQQLEGQGPLPEPQALHWIDQVLDALDYLHRRQVIHRDVKPANIKITPQGAVFLVDFGLAKLYDPRQETTMGARGVTPGYAPVEQYGQARTDARSDVYSAGASLYSMLTGQIPPDALALATRQAHLSPIRQLNPKVSPQVEAAVLRAMQNAPDDRFQTAAEFRAALKEPPTQRVAGRESLPRTAAAGPAVVEPPGSAAQVAALFAQARVAFDRESWTEAEARCREVLNLDAQHREAQALLHKARTGRQLSRGYAQAQAAMQAGEWEAAVVALEQVVAVDASYRDAQSRLREARHALLAASARPEPEREQAAVPTPSPPPSGAQGRQAQEPWARLMQWRPRALSRLALGILLAAVVVLIAVSAGLYALFSAPADKATPTADAGGAGGTALPAGLEGILYTSNLDGQREIYRLGSEEPIQMTHTDGGESWGAVATDAGILFTSTRDGKREIYRLHGGDLERMTHTDGGESWGPNPSATGVLFTRTQQGKREVWRLHGGNAEQMTATDGGESWDPAPSAAGILLTRTANGMREIWRLHGGDAKQMTHTPGGGESWGPVATPDGILFTSNQSGKREIWRLHGGDREQLTDTPGDAESWSPVATEAGILFTSNQAGKREVYRLNGGEPERVTWTPDPWESWVGDDE